MITENKAMASGALTYPYNDEDAAARIAEYTASAESTRTGLFGLVFRDLEQFCRAMRQCGYVLDLPLIMNGMATTWMGVAILRRASGEVRVELVVHSFGPYVQIINVK